MSKLRYTTAALSLAALTGFSSAHAQTTINPPTTTSPPVTQPGQPVLSGQPIQQPTQQPTQQPGQQPGQVNTLPGQAIGTPVDQDGRYQANRVTNDSRMSQQQGPTVKEALVQKLIKSNKAEIELATMAQQKTDNEELKQLASTIVQDHQQLNKTLQQHAGNTSDPGKKSDNRSSNPNAASATTSAQSGRNQTGMNTVPKEFCQVAEQACDNALEMTKEMLGKQEGQDFNMAFLGQQCFAHTMMLAELKAIQSSGPEELQQIASQAAEKVEMHLEKAKQLAKKLEDDRKKKNQS